MSCLSDLCVYLLSNLFFMYFAFFRVITLLGLCAYSRLLSCYFCVILHVCLLFANGVLFHACCISTAFVWWAVSAFCRRWIMVVGCYMHCVAWVAVFIVMAVYDCFFAINSRFTLDNCCFCCHNAGNYNCACTLFSWSKLQKKFSINFRKSTGKALVLISSLIVCRQGSMSLSYERFLPRKKSLILSMMMLWFLCKC